MDTAATVINTIMVVSVESGSFHICFIAFLLFFSCILLAETLLNVWEIFREGKMESLTHARIQLLLNTIQTTFRHNLENWDRYYQWFHSLREIAVRREVTALLCAPTLSIGILCSAFHPFYRSSRSCMRGAGVAHPKTLARPSSPHSRSSELIARCWTMTIQRCQ